ncbi:hypothetical protein ElyMa_002385600 [Elysia marginata]|uniref:Uncharacterized protein n=1 Tax=Elysia marginata TaxID=1093978 RepID=A0AAV4GCN1_9GAST|nr:hypothetical protein ElyMa_002385600 [Elysia marginata]
MNHHAYDLPTTVQISTYALSSWLIQPLILNFRNWRVSERRAHLSASSSITNNSVSADTKLGRIFHGLIKAVERLHKRNGAVVCVVRGLVVDTRLSDREVSGSSPAFGSWADLLKRLRLSREQERISGLIITGQYSARTAVIFPITGAYADDQQQSDLQQYPDQTTTATAGGGGGVVVVNRLFTRGLYLCGQEISKPRHSRRLSPPYM